MSPTHPPTFSKTHAQSPPPQVVHQPTPTFPQTQNPPQNGRKRGKKICPDVFFLSYRADFLSFSPSFSSRGSTFDALNVGGGVGGRFRIGCYAGRGQGVYRFLSPKLGSASGGGDLGPHSPKLSFSFCRCVLNFSRKFDNFLSPSSQKYMLWPLV